MTGYRYAYFFWGEARSVVHLAVLLAVLNAGLVLPSFAVAGLSAGDLDDLVSFDLIVLFALVLLANGTRMQRGVRYLATGGYAFLLVYELYDAAVQMALKRPGILYDDIKHVAGTLHLIRSAAEPLHLVVGALGLGGLAGFAWFALRAFREISARLDVRFVRRLSVVGVTVSLGVLLYALVTDRGDYMPLYNEAVVMTAEKIAGNITASVQLHERLHAFNRLPADSTYAQYETASLSSRPHLFILFIESYGEVLRRHEEIKAPYRAMMQDIGARLSRKGWSSASASSEAPVNGGTSWLSVGSVLMGMPIKHQSMFNVIEPDLDRYPHLIRALQAHGYETAALQPPTRPQLGVRVSNPYGFDETFYFEDMQYTGPRYGWGIVPDQYSLNLVHEQFVAPAEGPVALLFEIVASHAPWGPPPPFVDDWRTLNERHPASRAPRSAETAREVQPPVVATGTASGPPLPNVSGDKTAPVHHLFRTIRYDWQVISEYMMNEMPDSSLVVVLGDHQPPILSTGDDAVPVHIFSRDPAHIDAAVSHGFQRGLVAQMLSQSAGEPAFQHAGLYSLMMNLMAQPLPRETASRSFPVLPGGVDRPAHRGSSSR